MYSQEDLDFFDALDGVDPGTKTMNNSFLDKLLDTGLGALGVITANQTAKNNAALTAKQQAALLSAQNNQSKTWLPIVIIGGAIALVVVLIVALKK